MYDIRKMRIVRLCLVMSFALACGCVAREAAPVTPAPAVEAKTAEPIAEDTVQQETPVPVTPAPTPTATPTPTPTPTPEPTPTPTPEPIRITQEMLDDGRYDSYFDDAVFVGDSLTRSLSNYVREVRQKNEDCLGEAQFMGTVSMSVKNACTNKAYPGEVTFYYRGRAVSVTEGITNSGAKKAFIMLGLNDLAYRKWEAVEENFAQLIDVIRENCPDTQIVILGVLPVTAHFCKSNKVAIETWNSFNVELERIATEHGAAFYSFAEQMMDKDGYLLDAYADGNFHLTESGERIWIRAMRVFAARELEPDAVFEITDEEGQ